MRFQHSVGLLTNNNSNNNNNNNGSDSDNSPIYGSNSFESIASLNQTIQFTRDLNFTSKPVAAHLETALKSINGNFTYRDKTTDDNGDDELIHCQSTTTALKPWTDNWNGNQKLSTVKTQERQSQYTSFGKAVKNRAEEFISAISEETEPQLQSNSVKQLKLDLEGNLNNNDHQQSDSSNSSTTSSPTSVTATTSSSGSSPDNDSFLDDDEDDDIDDDSFSPGSSSVSHNVRLKNFPRGIINPNYPGFQHLAHRLAEHFVNHSFEQCSDSDVSDDFEYDMSQPIENTEIITSLPMVDRETEDSGRSSDGNSSPTCSSLLDFMQDEDKKAMTPDILIEHNSRTTKDTEVKTVPDLTDCDDDDKSTYRKFDEYTNNNYFQWDYQPDLIKNINNDTVDLKDYFNGGFCENNEITELPDTYDVSDAINEPLVTAEVTTLPTPNAVIIKSGENMADNFNIQSTTSTIDIVGDFGREIEKEIGLIVSGYTNQTLGDSYFQQSHEMVIGDDRVDVAEAREKGGAIGNGKVDDCKDEQSCVSESNEKIDGDEKTMTNGMASAVCNKMTDAVLSNANEIINICPAFDELVNRAQQHYQPNVNTCSDKHNEHQQQQQQQLEQNISDDSERKIDYASLRTNINSDKCAEQISAKPKLPTAIVKPKYQKSSFDERQLPPIGCLVDNNAKPWYVSSGSSKKLPNFERKSHKLASSRVSEKEAYNSLRHREKDVDCSRGGGSVAIVQPRKKDKMELNNYDKKCKSAATVLYEDNNCKNNNNNSTGNNNNNNNNSLNSFAYDNKKAINNSSNNYTKSKNSGSINKCGENECSNSKSGKPGVKLRKTRKDVAASFDVYNIETALPVIDLEAIESHLKAAKEEDRRRRNDREEIRRRLAMGADDDYYRKYSDKPGRKPSLQSRLQNGMNLQICFMNETASDTESPSSDSETCPKLSKTTHSSNHQNNNHHQVLTHNKLSSAYINPYNTRPLSVQKLPSSTTTKISSLAELGYDEKVSRPTFLSLGPPAPENSEIDFFTKQAKLQIEARMALAQAKDMAHMQMEIDRQRQQISPITQIIRTSMDKVGIKLPEDKRRLSRQLLTSDINIAQLQIIVNDLHTEIEKLNEKLMNYLMERDELHMGQDSMLVDIEDLTRYLSAKEQNNHDVKLGQTPTQLSPNNNLPASLVRTLSANSPAVNAPNKTNQLGAQSKLSRITQLVKK